MAINQNGVGGAAAGDLYVVDRGGHRVERFDASGAFKGAFGLNVGGAGVNTCTTGCVAGTSGTVGGAFATPQSVAVDQVDGSVYVLDGANLRIQKFTAAGDFLWAVGQNVLTGSPATGTVVCTVAANCKIATTGSQGGTFATGFTGQAAVDPVTRTVYVTDPGNRRVQQLTAAGAFIRTFGFDVDSVNPSTGFEICTIASECKIAVAATTAAAAAQGQFPTNQPTRVAVDSAGAVYTVEQTVTFRVQKFTPFGIGLVPSFFAADTLNGTAAASTPADVAIDPATQNVLVAKAFAAGATSPCPSGANSVVERRILELTSSGGSADTHMACAGINVVNGLAIRRSDASDHAGGIYASSTTDGQRVYLLNTTGATAPTATVTPATAIDTHTATLNGEVNRNDPASALSLLWHFEYSKNGTDWTSAPAANSIISGVTSDPVSLTPQNLTGIEANQTYKVRIVATKQYNSASIISGEATFTTLVAAPESVATQPAFPIRSTAARLNGRLNANNESTSYRFEYGLDTDYGSSLPAEGDGAASGGTVSDVTQWATGLAPGTTYHYRLVAENAHGAVTGADQQFTTASAVADAPDGRAYEMVTPAHKSTRRGGISSVDGFGFPLTGIASRGGDSVIAGIDYGVMATPGASFSGDYNRFERGEDGWTTEPIMNHPAIGSVDLASAAPDGASADQERQVWRFAGAGSIFPEQVSFGNKFATRFMTGAPAGTTPSGWTSVSGWGAWTTAANQYAGSQNQATLFTDDRRYLVRSGYLRGLAGPSDPSVGQLSATSGGATVYRQDFEDGSVELVSGCIGTGLTATLIPERVGTGSATSDTIGAQQCADGSLTSTRGAAIGGGNITYSTSAAATLAGIATNAASNAPGHSGDRVFFLSPDPTALSLPTACATGAGASTSCPPQLYVRRWAADGTPDVAWISRSRRPNGEMIAGQAIGLMGRGVGYEGASVDGSKVLFRTNAPLTVDDPNGAGVAPPPDGVVSEPVATSKQNSWDLYQYELPADPDADPDSGTLTRISGGPTGTADPNTNCAALSGANCDPNTGGRGAALRHVSADGSKVYFVTAAPIAGAVDAPPVGSSAGNVAGGTAANISTRNLYLYDADKSGPARWKFIARLPFSTAGLDGCASTYTTSGLLLGGNSQSSPVSVAAAPRNCVRGTESGSMITFMTSAQLTADDADAAQDMYVYDAASDEIVRASAPQGVAEGSSYTCVTAGAVQCNATVGWEPYGGASEMTAGPSGNRQLNISADGAVYFESRRRLIPGDTNGTHMDVYRWKEGELSLVSPGNSDDDAFFSGNSVSGRDVFLTTTQPLDPYREIEAGDYDIYDARVGGGFPPPPPGPDRCEVLANDCQEEGRHPGGATEPPTGEAGNGNAPVAARRTLSLAPLSKAQRVRAARRGVLRLRIRTNAVGVVVVRVRGRINGRSRLVASGSRRVGAAGRAVSLALRLRADARRALRSGRPLTLSVSARASGSPRPRTMTVRLRRAGR